MNHCSSFVRFSSRTPLPYLCMSFRSTSSISPTVRTNRATALSVATWRRSSSGCAAANQIGMAFAMDSPACSVAAVCQRCEDVEKQERVVTYEFFLRRENVVDAGVSQLRSCQGWKMVDLQRNVCVRQSPQPFHILVLEDLLRESLRLCEVPAVRGHSGPMVSNSPKRVHFILDNISPSRCGCILVSAALCTGKQRGPLTPPSQDTLQPRSHHHGTSSTPPT